MAEKKPAPVQLPSDLTSLSDDQLAALLSQVDGEFDAQIDSAEGDPDARVARATELADMHDKVVSQQDARATAAAERETTLATLRGRVHPETPADETDPAEATDPAVDPAAPAVPTGVTAGATTVARGAEVTNRAASGQTLPPAGRRLNPTIGEIAAQTKRDAGTLRQNSAVLLASADIPGVAMGAELPDSRALTAAIQARVRNLPVTHRGFEAPWYPVAAMQREHKFTLDRDATPEQIDEVLQAAANPDALVAAGGWCAPSEISYDFYSIVCEDGMLDLPTVGVSRGGLRWPTSPSYGDIVDSYWSWNETQDVAALTGTAQSGSKTCVRVPCVTYNEQRLHCDGFCLTVGNLMEEAFPENIANYTRLLTAGNSHRMNTLRINELLLSANSTPVTGVGAGGAGLVAPVCGAVELAAIDMREKFRMCGDAVLEVVLPRWLRGAMRADLRKRMGGDMDMLQVTDATLMNMFDLMNVRVQWVTDWQVGGSGQPGQTAGITSWPTSVQFLIFPAGTFVLGRGLQLSLGVIRDSVLNATNDHTAEWMEECWFIAKIGHESRLYTVAICADGTTGAADLTACTF